MAFSPNLKTAMLSGWFRTDSKAVEFESALKRLYPTIVAFQWDRQSIIDTWRKVQPKVKSSALYSRLARLRARLFPGERLRQPKKPRVLSFESAPRAAEEQPIALKGRQGRSRDRRAQASTTVSTRPAAGPKYLSDLQPTAAVSSTSFATSPGFF